MKREQLLMEQHRTAFIDGRPSISEGEIPCHMTTSSNQITRAICESSVILTKVADLMGCR
jgi:hypothetical protein